MKTHKVCSKCKEIKLLDEYSNDKRSSDGKVSRCKVCKRNDNKLYYKENGRILTQKQKKEKSKRDVEYKRKRRKEDTLFRFKDNISRLIRKGINKGYTKESSTYEILGIEEDGFKEYIQSKFQKGMSWDNYGEWHIDHIIPQSSGKNKEEVHKLNHYQNLQPLWKEENLSKGNRYKEEDKEEFLSPFFKF